MNPKLFQSICNAPGIPGFEDAVQAIAAGIFETCCDTVTRDPLGNLIGLKKAKATGKGKQPLKLMLAAHADEPAMMVTRFDGKGMIKFRMVGGVNPVMAQSQRVLIHTGAKKPVRGCIVPKDADCKLDALCIDTGLSKEKLETLVPLGSPITIDEDASVLNGKMWVGRNFDNRVGNYCLVEAMRQVGDTHVDVYAVSSVQEEVGLRGARAAAGRILPDMALAIDGSMTKGAYDDGDNLCEPGKGTGIYMIDKLTIGHPKLVKHLFAMCAKHKIPHQLNIGGGTDAAAIQQCPGGCIVTTVGAPVRYMHSTVQLCHADDIDATVALLVKFMETAHEFYADLGC